MIIGPRTVQFKEDYTVFVTAVDYDEHDNKMLQLSLDGYIGDEKGEQIKTHKIKLKHMNQAIKFYVSQLGS